MKKKRIKLRKMKKKTKIVGVIILVLVFLCFIIFMIHRKNESDLLKKIKSHYNDKVIVNKKANLYDQNQKVIGKVEKDFHFSLEKVRLNSTKKQYFNIKNTTYYLYYEDIKPIKEKKQEKINDHYLTFNFNVETSKKTTLYYQNKEAMVVKKKINLPVEYMDDKYYYVTYLDDIFGLKRDSSKLVKHQNSEEKEAEYISVLHYNTIDNKENCREEVCVSLEKLEEHIKYLKEQGYYSITLDEYRAYLNKNIRLKEKAILLTTSTKNDILDKYNQEALYKIELIKEGLGLKFHNTNKKSTKESNIESIDRYQIKTTTSDENFRKMVAGEDVVEIVPTRKSSSREQAIPVLNYHFFYNPSIGEQCNENICLEVDKFREQLSYLKTNGYRTLKMDEFRKWMYGEIDLPEKSVLITVDDGAMGTGRHNGNKLIPILEEYGMNATLFLITGWWDVNNYRSNYLDIQSHTNDMHQYGSCGKGQVICASKEALKEDLKKSLMIVDNNNSFCFPFYSYNDSSIETIKEIGFRLAFIGGSRKAKRSDHKFMVPRYPIHKNTSMNQFINMVN